MQSILVFKKAIAMTSIQQAIVDQASKLKPGQIFTVEDLPPHCRDNSMAASKALSRLTAKGVIKRYRRGLYYAPRMTTLGDAGPVTEDVIERLFLMDGLKRTGYLTGGAAFLNLKISTQVSNTLTVATVSFNRLTRRSDGNIRYIKGYVEDFQPEDVPLLQALDTLRLIRKAPGANCTQVLQGVSSYVSRLSLPQKFRMLQFALRYPPRTRALMGAISQNLGIDGWEELKSSIRPAFRYQLPVSPKTLPNKTAWGMV